MPTRQSVHAYRATISGVQTGAPFNAATNGLLFPLKGQVASFAQIDLAEFDNTALITFGSPTNYQIMGPPSYPAPTNPFAEIAEIVGIITWGSGTAFNSVEFDWRSGGSFSIAADFVTVGAYINQCVANLAQVPAPVISTLVSVDVTITIGPSPGKRNQLQRTLAYYNAPLSFIPYAPGTWFPVRIPPYAFDVRPVPSPGTTWKLDIQNFASPLTVLGPQFTVASGTSPLYLLSNGSGLDNVGGGPGGGDGAIKATCLAGSGFCRLTFDLDL
jgi:hypothetical protein